MPRPYSMIRVGVGQSSVVRDVALQTKVDQILSDTDVGQLDKSIAGTKVMELQSSFPPLHSIDTAFVKAFEWNCRESVLIS